MSTTIALGIFASLIAGMMITLHFLLILFTPQPIPTHPTEEKYTTTPSSHPSQLPSISDPPTKRLSIIVPAYNEEDRLGVMIDEAMAYFAGSGPGPRTEGKGNEGKRRKRIEGGVEILVVDDGSKDQTSLVAMELAEKWGEVFEMDEDEEEDAGGGGVEVRVVRLRRNRGKGGAVQHGALHSRGQYILFADADGATRFSDLDMLMAAMEETEKDGMGMVVGSRAHLVSSDAVVKRSKLRNLLMHGFHFFLQTLGVDGIRDTQCGFKLFTRQTAHLLFTSLHLPRWSFDVELLLLASLCKPPIPVAEIPVAWHEVNGSKIRLGWDSLGMARDLLVLRGNLAVGRWKVPEIKGYANGASEVKG